MALPALLFALPLVTALILLVNRNPAVRNTLVRVSALLMAVLSVAVGVMYFGHPFKIGVDSPLVRLLMMAVDGLAALTVLYFCVKYKRYLTALLGLAQFFLIVAFEFHAGSYARSVWDFNIDNLSIIMILIAGIIGGLIAVYSLGYMAVYHRKHVDVKDRRSFFFFVVFLFLSAMFGLVMSNNLLYMYTFWEITSLCSFLLIGYSGTNEAIHNSFKALWMNLLGGLAFAMAIAYLGEHFYTLEISQLLSMGMQGMPVEPVVALLVFCGFTKSAMMPFSGWLLGAMVAPTPTSALLHSSTMVKAGVFLIIKLAPILGNNHAGIMAMLVGGITFFFASIFNC